MPGRWLRPSITSAEPFNALSFAAQSLLCPRLMSIVDDFGRCDGRYAVILGQCFTIWNVLHPEPAHVVTLDRLGELLLELAAHRHIEIYKGGVFTPDRKQPAEQVEDRNKVTLQILNWRERIRDTTKEHWPARATFSKLLLPFHVEHVEPQVDPAGAQDSADHPAQEHAGFRRQNPPPTPTPTPSPVPTPSPCRPPGDSKPAALAQNGAGNPQANPAAESEFITSIDEAKALICATILGGKNPGRLWSTDATKRLSDLCKDPGLPRAEVKRIAWFRGLPPSDEIPELMARRQITETGLMNYWGDEATRAEAYWQKVKGYVNGQPPKKKKAWPDGAREWLQNRYGQDGELRIPERFDQLPEYVQDEWDEELRQQEAARA